MEQRDNKQIIHSFNRLDSKKQLIRKKDLDKLLKEDEHGSKIDIILAGLNIILEISKYIFNNKKIGITREKEYGYSISSFLSTLSKDLSKIHDILKICEMSEKSIPVTYEELKEELKYLIAQKIELIKNNDFATEVQIKNPRAGYQDHK